MTGARATAPRALFVATILAGSFLLFLVQPMVARMALPRLGGAPAVWNSAMLVYQALLLGGYAYAHALGRVRPKVQAMVHLGVLAAAALWLPIGLMAWDLPADASPAIWVPWLLGLSIGPLFFAISAQAPLIQRWFALASGGRDPYQLYAASNLGSFGGLLAYPLIVEPAMTLHGQSWLWSGGYLLVFMLVAGCAWALPRGVDADAAAPSSAAPRRSRVALWVGLAFVPSGLMLATSTYITTDIVAMPLLWVIPLGLYLLSFTIAFAARRDVADVLTRIAPITILLFGGIMVGGYQERPYLNAGLALVLLFMVSVALHTQMYRLRPAADRLTGFYLAMSIGGALGGVFAGLIAPVVFDWTYEYPILILAAGALVPQVYLTGWLRAMWMTPSRRTVALVVIGGAILILFLLRAFGPEHRFGEEQGHGLMFIVLAIVGLATVGTRLPYLGVLMASLALFGGYRAIALTLHPDARTRSYFGVYTVSGVGSTRQLAHGTTLHGIQLTGTAERERTPTTYYVRGSGVGNVMEAAPILYGPRARIGVVGLGTGTLACYAQPGQSWRFYEIDPTVVRIARDTGQFTFLRDCLPDAGIVIGDARLRLAEAAPGSLDVLALDAFSSDAIPMHLLTQEAFATYGRALSPRGVLVVHISNRFLDLQPVVAAAARAGGWRTLKLVHTPSTLDESGSASIWVALSRDPHSLAILHGLDGRWRPLNRYPNAVAWTDDYSTILPLLKPGW